MPTAIEQFSGRYRFLSNFYIEPDGTHVEGEFQALKCSNPADWSRFRGLSPVESKSLGKQIKLRSDWEQVKDEVMYECVRKKFHDHPELARKLIETSGMELVEGNTWGDTTWGVCEEIGENRLGRILMIVRRELAEGE